MSYDHSGRPDSSTAVIVVAVIAGLVIALGLLALGAFLFVGLRARTAVRLQRQRALVVQRQAMEQHARLAAQRDRAWQQQTAANEAAIQVVDELTDAPSSLRQISIQLNDQGHLEVDGEPMSLVELERRLRAAEPSVGVGPSVVICADGRCLFEHVSSVLSVCEQAGIEDVRVVPCP
jgi:biopolymer transport protein ExbD